MKISAQIVIESFYEQLIYNIMLMQLLIFYNNLKLTLIIDKETIFHKIIAMILIIFGK